MYSHITNMTSHDHCFIEDDQQDAVSCQEPLAHLQNSMSGCHSDYILVLNFLKVGGCEYYLQWLIMFSTISFLFHSDFTMERYGGKCNNYSSMLKIAEAKNDDSSGLGKPVELK